MRTGIVFSLVFIILMKSWQRVSQAVSSVASTGLFRMTKRHCWRAPIVIDAGWRDRKAQRLEQA
jgi:hypothetical protein